MHFVLIIGQSIPQKMLLIMPHIWFTGKRKYIKKLVVVAEHLYDRQPCEQSALELASAYMQAQRYADAYSTFQDVLKKMPDTINKNVSVRRRISRLGFTIRS